MIRQKFQHITICLRLLPGILFFFAAPLTVLSQEVSINGRITDTEGDPLPGVTVVQTETRRATLSRNNGTFSISSGESGATLVFSKRGYVSQQVEAGANDFIVVRLEKAEVKSLPPRVDSLHLDLYSWKADNASGVFNSASSGRFSKTEKDFSDVLQSLPGIVVQPAGGQPGSFSHVLLRGLTSGTSGQPLFIVDGVVLNAGINLPGSFQTMDPLYGVNPADIDRVTVLSDHASTAIYGSRGANGVVLIETIPGGADSLLVSWQGQAGISMPVKGVPLMTGGPYFSMLDESLGNAGMETPEIPTSFTSRNWPENIVRNAFYTAHTLSVSGGGPKSKVYASGNIKREAGVVSGSGIHSGGVRFNHRWMPAGWFRSKINLHYSQDAQETPVTREYPATGNPLIYAAMYPPVSRYNLSAFPLLPERFGAYDPREFLEEQMAENTASVFSGNMDFSFRFLKYFSWHTRGGGSYNDFGQSYDILFPTDDAAPPEYRQNRYQTGYVYNWQLNSYLKFEKLTGKSHWLILAGAEKNYVKGKETADYKYSGMLNEIMLPAYAFTGNNSRRGTALFGQLNYALDKKFDFSAAFRREEMIRQKGGKLYGIFPALSAGVWLYRNEAKRRPLFSGLKIKGGWGLPGADAFHFLHYTASGHPVALPGDPREVIREQIPARDANARWEVSEEWNFGILTSWLGDDARLEVNYFDRMRSNVGFLSLAPAAAGYQYDRGYTGRIRNAGFEVKADYRKDWGKNEVFANVFLQSAVNELLQLGADDSGRPAALPGYFSGSPYGTISPGDPVGAFKGYIKEKIFQSPEEIEAANRSDGDGSTFYQDEWTAPGDIKFADLDGNGRIDERDITTIGDPSPGVVYTITGGAVTGAIDFALTFDGATDYDILNLNRTRTHATGGLGNRSVEMEERWTPFTPSVTLPRLHLYDPNGNSRPHSGMVENGSFFRLSKLSVGYTVSLPDHFRQTRIFVSCYNLFTASGYSGQSPYLKGTGNAYGVDYGLYPGSVTLLIGVQLGL